MVLPNAGLSNGVITNNSANPIRRIDITITTDFSADVPTVRRIMQEAASSPPGVLQTRPLSPPWTKSRTACWSSPCAATPKRRVVDTLLLVTEKRRSSWS